MPIMHEQQARAGLIRRAGALTVASTPAWGKMSVDQMLWHVNAQLEVAMDKRPCEMIDNLFKRTVFKPIALYGPWPKGKAPTAKEMKATGQYDIEAERRRFAALADEFAQQDMDASWRAHPAFGPLTGKQWSLLAWRHADHHFRQFSV
jgi:hypothetical protein